ncbi:MAG: NADH-quinone oxidoreductase subunit C [Candidatus Omnitrophica bacterium]|nr:NADH-quinone oxidoreductase subunit C [Candidatus Omnitrophota bacterium]
MEKSLISRLKEFLAEKIVESANPSKRRIFIKVLPENLPDTIQILKEKTGFTHLSTITGVDKGETFEILYHFANKIAVLTVRTEVPAGKPEIKTITKIIPGAILYERELQDMFGIKVMEIPDPRPLILPDGWPEGNYPLRKNWKYQRPEEIIPGGGK